MQQQGDAENVFLRALVAKLAELYESHNTLRAHVQQLDERVKRLESRRGGAPTRLATYKRR
jgi:hypothetical protein